MMSRTYTVQKHDKTKYPLKQYEKLQKKPYVLQKVLLKQVYTPVNIKKTYSKC